MATRETVAAIMDMTGEAKEHRSAIDHIFVHMKPRTDLCEHDFQGWREFYDGRGGEKVCTKCGLGAMAHTLSLDF